MYIKRHVMTQVDVVFPLSYQGTDGTFPWEKKKFTKIILKKEWRTEGQTTRLNSSYEWNDRVQLICKIRAEISVLVKCPEAETFYLPNRRREINARGSCCLHRSVPWLKTACINSCMKDGVGDNPIRYSDNSSGINLCSLFVVSVRRQVLRSVKVMVRCDVFVCYFTNTIPYILI